MRDVVCGLGLAVLSVAAASSAKADQSAVPLLSGFANYVAGACQNAQCPSLKITASTLYQNDHARYCVVDSDAHDSGAGSGPPPAGPGAQQGPVPVPTVLSGQSAQYRSEASWTYAQVIAAAGATPPQPALITINSYPFSPFNQPKCDVKINVQNGAMTIGSIEGSNEPTASFDVKLIGAMLVGVQTTSSNGGGGTTPIVIEKTTTPFYQAIR